MPIYPISEGFYRQRLFETVGDFRRYVKKFGQRFFDVKSLSYIFPDELHLSLKLLESLPDNYPIGELLQHLKAKNHDF